jgi:class 3 adenylate cyclase/tetratricopeptide (TPR) repeat protein
MSAYLEALGSFVPSLIVREANAGHLKGSEPHGARIEAALLFADVSGFTALTERLAAEGPAGAENLTQILNLYFGGIIDLVERWGGDVVKFAGDALIALWPHAETSDELVAGTARAVACGLELQKSLAGFDAGGGLTLSMKVSIGAGSIFSSHLGGVYERWEFLLAGTPLEQVGIANGLAKPGDVLVSPEAREILGSALEAEAVEADEGHAFRVTGARAAAPPETASPRPQPGAAGALRRYIPGAIRARIDAGQTDWLGERRRVSVIFMNLPDFGVRTPLAEAHRATRAMQLALYRFEGSINKISVDDKGASLIAVLGLPPLGHEDDPERAVRAALAMRDSLAEAGHSCSIGITTGQAFCGAIGNARRREYTVMGDVVNLAARLMQAAKGGVLADAATWSAARRRLPFEALPPIKVKGKAAPVAVYRPVESVGDEGETQPVDAVSLLGREAELARVDARLDALAQEGAGSGGAIVVEAERGMGKSVFLGAISRHAGERGLTVLTGGGDPIDRQTPYRAWRPVFEALFRGALASPDPAARRYSVLGELPGDPRILKDAALLEAVLPLDWPETDETRNLSGSDRGTRTRRLLAAILADVASRRPLVLVVNDAQWIDSASSALIESVMAEAPSVLVIVSHTTEQGAAADWVTGFAAGEGVETLPLPALPDEAVVEIARRRIGIDAMPPLAARLIVERAEGVPLHAEEIAISLREQGLIAGEGADVRWTGGDDLEAVRLPDSMEGLITARIDRLPPSEQLTIKVASVIGSVFDSTSVCAIHPMSNGLDEVTGHCEILDRALLTPRVSGGGEGPSVYRFKSDLLMRVIYDMMLFSQRRELHQTLAERMEEDGTAAAPEMAAVMAHHWHRAAIDRTPHPRCARKAAEYYRLVGRRAATAGAGREAQAAFRQAIELLAQVPMDAERVALEIDLQLGLGAMLMAAHGWADPNVGAVFARARALCLDAGQTDLLFRTVRGQWQVAVGTSDYAAALDLARELLGLADHARDGALRREALRALGTTSFYSGHVDAARAALSEALAIDDGGSHTMVSLMQDPEIAARGIHAWTLAFAGEADQARAAADAARHAAEAGGMPPFTRAFAHGAAMWAAHYLGDVAMAREEATACRNLSLERGFDYMATAADVVLGWAEAMAGRPDGLARTEHAIAAWHTAGWGIGMPAFLLVLARTRLALGDAAGAEAALDDPLMRDRLPREPWLQPPAAFLRARVRAALGDAVGAEEAARAARRFADEQGARLYADPLGAVEA